MAAYQICPDTRHTNKRTDSTNELQLHRIQISPDQSPPLEQGERERERAKGGEVRGEGEGEGGRKREGGGREGKGGGREGKGGGREREKEREHTHKGDGGGQILLVIISSVVVLCVGGPAKNTSRSH